MKATTEFDGRVTGLREIGDCWISIPGVTDLIADTLWDINDKKSAVYNEDPVIGRSSPMHTFSHSATRSIGVTIHFHVVDPGDAVENLRKLRAIESCVYTRPGGGAPFKPPVICKLKCGKMLTNGEPLCVILQSYSVDFPNDVARDEETLCPMMFDVQTEWWVVYTSKDLPDSDRIYRNGR